MTDEVAHSTSNRSGSANVGNSSEVRTDLDRAIDDIVLEIGAVINAHVADARGGGQQWPHDDTLLRRALLDFANVIAGTVLRDVEVTLLSRS